MKVILDAYGGDNAPLEILKGAAMAVSELGVSVMLTGDEQDIRRVAEENSVDLTGMEIVDCQNVIPVEADPSEILKSYADCSMAVGLQRLAEGEGDAFITAGSTGAAVVGATFIVKRIKGVKRAALGTVIPCAEGCYMLLDIGANAECRPEMLVQFGLMGSAYMEGIQGVKNPRVGLVNIGAERTKGLDLQLDAYGLMEKAPFHFTGNVEARDLPLGGCDVAVADGFVGNIVLKLTEGMASFFSRSLKGILLKNLTTKIGALLIQGGVKDFKAQMDYTEYGGAPLMGIAKPVIKAHGSSNAKAIKNAIRQAKLYHENNVVDVISRGITALAAEKKEEQGV
ncbi:phosphate acyltransferase PlsX [Oscillospiraceae bacterium MB08-C2-2]|nr:phosphate acyltransferase PlsX [Oscillospiraceae bacterium MB08-C2-2]